MKLTLLCVGDVVGRPGRYVLSQALPRLVKQYDIDCVIANVENAAGGSGLTPQLYEKFLRYGVDLMTLGDHAFRKMDIAPVLAQSDRLVRPANFPPQAPGKGLVVLETRRGHRVAVLTVLGRLFMKPALDCPFTTVDRLLKQLDADVHAVVVEIHAEATSEKVAMGWHLDGRASLVFGTHTHVQTADECVLPRGTAYITDLGMTGPHDSVLGRRKDRVLHTLLTALPSAFEVADGAARLCGAVVVINCEPGTPGRAVSIERVVINESDLPAGERECGDERC